MRNQGLIQKLTSAGLNINDAGDVECHDRAQLSVGHNPKLRYLDEIIRISHASARLAETAIKDGQRVIGLGGDHSMTLGLVSGVSTAVQGDLGVIYFDAHGDMNTDATTPTGNIHGMQLASLMGFGTPELAQVHTKKVKFSKHNLLHIAGNDFDQAELNLVEKEGLTTYHIADILLRGLEPLLAKIDALAGRVGHVYVSIDLDSIDQLYAPAAGMPNLGGLTYREIALLVAYIGQKCNVIGVDIVEYNPLQDQDHKTAELSTELIAKLFGANYSWYTNYLAQDARQKI
jgi:arginase